MLAVEVDQKTRGGDLNLQNSKEVVLTISLFHCFSFMSSNSKVKAVLKSRLLLKPPVDTDPRLHTTKRRGVILFCLALCACTPGFSSTIYFPGIKVTCASCFKILM